MGVMIENLSEKESLMEREIQNCNFRLKVLQFLKTELYNKKLFTHTISVFIQYFEELALSKKKEQRKREEEEEGQSLIRSYTQPIDDDEAEQQIVR